jgi:hypothetical protein
MINASTHTRKIWRSHFDGADSTSNVIGSVIYSLIIKFNVIIFLNTFIITSFCCYVSHKIYNFPPMLSPGSGTFAAPSITRVLSTFRIRFSISFRGVSLADPLPLTSHFFLRALLLVFVFRSDNTLKAYFC